MHLHTLSTALCSVANLTIFQYRRYTVCGVAEMEEEEITKVGCRHYVDVNVSFRGRQVSWRFQAVGAACDLYVTFRRVSHHCKTSDSRGRGFLHLLHGSNV